ncbi:hypothetical protein Tco_0741532 [Tanacetum coccineum]
MAERTMEELLRAPTEGYGEAIVLPKINVDHFEIKTNLLQLVQANPFHGLETKNPHAHINSFKRITSTLRFRNVPNDVIKLMMFPYSLEGAAKTWESVSKTDERIDKLADQLSTLVEIVSKKVFTPAPVKAVEETLCYLWWCTIIDQTTRYSFINEVSINRIDIIDEVCEEYAPELLGFSNKSSGGNPTLTSEPFTSEFILEEIEACLKDDSISPEIDHADCDPKGDICLIEKLLNNDPLQLPPMDLNQGEIIKAKPSIEEPPELELKDLPSYLEYAYFG